ncbi:hypothetical protein [uncultured Clostridium sp.]|uniref:hypothetical protein n=1 Tax=uncultured Clostridium sp. TaxID=59620 RepID=UPI0025F9A0FE|nr:hypothetical protein [uncultured Clostridium sp.]
MEDIMREDIGKRFIWNNEEVEIVNTFTCYDGDFIEYKILRTGKIIKINIWNDLNFVRAIPK